MKKFFLNFFAVFAGYMIVMFTLYAPFPPIDKGSVTILYAVITGCIFGISLSFALLVELYLFGNGMHLFDSLGIALGLLTGIAFISAMMGVPYLTSIIFLVVSVALTLYGYQLTQRIVKKRSPRS